MMSKEDSGSIVDLDEIQEITETEPIVDTSTQPETETPVEPTDISLPLRRTSRVIRPPEYYGFHITKDG